MLFQILTDTANILADATEENSNLCASAVDVAHRTHNGVLDAVGLNHVIPTPVKVVTDHVWDTSRDIIRDTGHQSASLLRNLGGASRARHHEDLSLEGDDLSGRGFSSEVSGPPMKHPSSPVQDKHDPRDRIYKQDSKPIVGQADLRQYFPKVYSQLQMGSCTANAVAAAFEFNVNLQRLPPFEPSRLFIWYYARWYTYNGGKEVHMNVGSNIRDAIKSLATQGVCSEADWPYEEGKYDEHTKKFTKEARAGQTPPARAGFHAHNHTAIHYHRIDEKHPLKSLMNCLDNGYPFLFGMKTYGLLGREPVKSTGHGLKPPTTVDMRNDEHRHSVLGVGYLLEEKLFIIRNSWGEKFGESGYFYMPFDYLKHCYDFWVLHVVHSPPGKD